MKKLFIAITVAVTLAACKTLTAPVEVAQTPEQKAFALYGTFVAFEEVAASLAVDATTPAAVKSALKTADATAKPAADALLDAAQEVLKVKVQVDAGATTSDKLTIVNARLVEWVTEAQPKILALQCAVNPKQKVCQK